MVHVVNQTGSRLTWETNLWTCLVYEGISKLITTVERTTLNTSGLGSWTELNGGRGLRTDMHLSLLPDGRYHVTCCSDARQHLFPCPDHTLMPLFIFYTFACLSLVVLCWMLKACFCSAPLSYLQRAFHSVLKYLPATDQQSRNRAHRVREVGLNEAPEITESNSHLIS